MRPVFGLMLLALLTGCAERFDATRLGVPVVMGNAAGQQVQGEPFTVRSTSVHAVWGVFTLSQASIQKALAGQLVGGRAVSNVQITVKSRWTDVLITGLTLGLIVPRTVEVKGVVLPQAPPPPESTDQP